MGGHVGVIWQPWEFVIIGGASLGTFVVANPLKTIKDTGAGLKEAFTSNAPGQQQYLEVLGILYFVMRELRSKPRNEVEEQLVEIWKRVLAAPQVGINDNFFELGGDSILSLQIIAQANRVGLRIVPKQVFDFPTIALLAPEIETVQVIHEEPELDPVPPRSLDFTASDFPEAALSQHELDQFLTTIGMD